MRAPTTATAPDSATARPNSSSAAPSATACVSVVGTDHAPLPARLKTYAAPCRAFPATVFHGAPTSTCGPESAIAAPKASPAAASGAVNALDWDHTPAVCVKT